VWLFYRVFKYARLYKHLYREYTDFDYLVSHLSDGVVEYDNQKTILRLNRAAEQMFGVKASDIVGFRLTADAKNEPNLAPLAELVYPTQHTSRNEKEDGTENEATEITIKHASKGEQHLRVFTIPRIDPRSRQLIGYIRIARDVTEDEIISSNKSDLVTIVSHQLRTPLAGIKWILQALVEGDFGALTPTQRDLIKKGWEANEGLIGLIDDMLDVAKIERSEFTYNFETRDIIAFIRDIVKSRADQAQAKNITIMESYAEQSLSTPIDQKRMRIALSNVLDNALHYSPPNGTITVSAKRDQNSCLVNIMDTGIGIPERDKPKLFNKYFRAENAQRIRTQGTGLGLFLVKTIVTGHGGTVWFESQEGKGTTFFISIPLARE
jgi:two-component system sensor histidine kinase VicK